MSSKVTPSLLKRPPCTTKKRFFPSGERIAFSSDDGGFVALTSVANGTRVKVLRKPSVELGTLVFLHVVKTCAKSYDVVNSKWRANASESLTL